MNILIAQDGFNTNNWAHDDWANATHFFTRPQLVKVLATLLMVQNDVSNGETYDDAINETIAALICHRIDTEDEEHPAPELSEAERDSVTRYLKDAVKEMRPYMPDGGALELITFVNEPETNRFFLVVRYHPTDEHSDKAFASPSLRS